MVTMTPTTVTCAEVRHALRQTHEGPRRERYHCLLRRLEGKSRPEMAPWL
jgi:hypothetical protein